MCIRDSTLAQLSRVWRRGQSILHESTRIENILKRLNAVEKGCVYGIGAKDTINVDTESCADSSSQHSDNQHMDHEEEEYGVEGVEQDFDGFSPPDNNPDEEPE